MTTEFKNEQRNIELLPKHEEVVFQSLHKDYGKVVVIEASLIGLFCILVGSSYWFSQLLFEEEYQFHVGMLYGTFLGTVIAVLILFFAVLGVSKKGYAVREHDLIYKSGLLNLKTTIVPFNRIQHVKVFESILLRSLGLSKLIFYTAGGNYGDLIIPGIPKEEADSIRAFVMKRVEEQSRDVVSDYGI